jgi:hypothetical protein
MHEGVQSRKIATKNISRSLIRFYSRSYPKDDVNSWQNFAAKFGRGTMARRELCLRTADSSSAKVGPQAKKSEIPQWKENITNVGVVPERVDQAFGTTGPSSMTSRRV